MISSARIRGVLGMALMWAISLTALATLILGGGVLLGLMPSSVFGIRQIGEAALRAIALGGAAGALFAVVLARDGTARTLAALTKRRMGAWGFVGAATVAALLMLAAPAFVPGTVLVAGVVAFGLIGAGLAVGALTIARRAPAIGAGDEAAPRILPPAI